MYKRVLLLGILTVVAVLALTACGGAAAPTAAPPTAAPQATTAPTAAPSGGASNIKVGLVTDVGGPDDRSFNATAIKGLNDAKAKLGLSPDSKYLV